MENERFEDCEDCGERYHGEDAIGSYLTEDHHGRTLCWRCWNERRLAREEDLRGRREKERTDDPIRKRQRQRRRAENKAKRKRKITDSTVND